MNVVYYFCPVQIDEPNVVGKYEIALVGEETSRHADDEGRGREQQLFGLVHASRQERYDREHVLERIEHGHERHDAHGQWVRIARLEYHFVLEHDERVDFHAQVDAEQLERQVHGKVDEAEARVVGQCEQHGRLVWKNVNLEFMNGRN